MDIEKLMNKPDQFFSGVTARITEQAIEFENRCIGEALSMWQIRKEDVLKRIHEADKLQAENEKLRAELEQAKRERDVAIEQLHGHCPACAHYTPNHNEGPCQFCCFEIARNENVEINDNWEWRGRKEV